MTALKSKVTLSNFMILWDVRRTSAKSQDWRSKRTSTDIYSKKTKRELLLTLQNVEKVKWEFKQTHFHSSSCFICNIVIIRFSGAVEKSNDLPDEMAKWSCVYATVSHLLSNSFFITRDICGLSATTVCLPQLVCACLFITLMYLCS